MKIVTKYEEDTDYYEWEVYTIEVDGKTEVSIGRPEPEDCSLGRDLSFAFNIVPLMKRAYEAGKNGEELIVVNE